VATLKEGFAEVGSDEARTSSDQSFHAYSSFAWSRGAGGLARAAAGVGFRPAGRAGQVSETDRDKSTGLDFQGIGAVVMVVVGLINALRVVAKTR